MSFYDTSNLPNFSERAIYAKTAPNLGVNDINIDGHLVTNYSLTGGSVSITSNQSYVTINDCQGTDVAGYFEFNANLATAVAGSDLVTIQLNRPFSVLPVIVVTAASPAGGDFSVEQSFFIGQPTTSSFTIRLGNRINTTKSYNGVAFNYIIIGAPYLGPST